MTRPCPRIAALLAAFLTIAPVATPIAQGRGQQTCGQIVDAFNARTRTLMQESEQKGFEFVHNEIFRDYGTTLQNAIDQRWFDDMKSRWERLQELRDQLNTAYLCLRGGGPCVTTIREQLTGKVKEWFDGLTSSTGLNAARDRVFEAMNILQTYTDQALSISTDTMTAMQQCAAPMSNNQPRLTRDSIPPVARVDSDGMPEIAEPTAKPVDAATAPPQNNGGGGMGALGWAALISGAAVGGVYGAQALSGLSCTDPGNWVQVCNGYVGGPNQGPACTAIEADMTTYCTCLGKRFSRTGGCV